MRTFAVSIAALVLCAGVSAADFALAPGTVPIETLFENAVLVCNCYVTGVEDQTTQIKIRGKLSLRHQVTASVKVQDFYKADDSSPSSLLVQYVVDEQQGVRVGGSRLVLSKGETALLFLTKNGDIAFQFADPFVGAVQFSTLPSMPGGPGLPKLQAALNTLGRQGTSDQLTALQVLLGFQHITDETRATAATLSESPDPNLALTAIGILLRTKSIDSLQQPERYLTSHIIHSEPFALYVIGPEVGDFRNPKALSTLEILGQSKYRSIKSGAMDAIRRIKSTKSIPYLMSKLSDPDRDAQYVALIAAAEILGKYEGDFAPSMYLFDQKPEYYLGLWKQWWLEEGSKVYPDYRHESSGVAPEH